MVPMQETIDTYNKAATAYADKFNRIGSREYDVEQALALWGKEGTPNVVEWGCGNGRDAEIIIGRAKSYSGIDASSAMIALAQQQVPQGDFQIADILSYELPEGTDIIFAFASLLHISKEQLATHLRKIHSQLSESAILYISLKKGEYEERVITDDFGPRTFYFYERQDIAEAAGELYTIIQYDQQMQADTPWFTCTLKKKLP